MGDNFIFLWNYCFVLFLHVYFNKKGKTKQNKSLCDHVIYLIFKLFFTKLLPFFYQKVARFFIMPVSLSNVSTDDPGHNSFEIIKALALKNEIIPYVVI